jgi:hypothetical protein
MSHYTLDTSIKMVFYDNNPDHIYEVSDKYKRKIQCIEVRETHNNTLGETVRDESDYTNQFVKKYKKNAYAQIVQSYVQSCEPSDHCPTNGITKDDLSKLREWIHDSEDTSEYHIFIDWDRTLSVTEGTLFPRQFDGPDGPDGITEEDLCTYVMGGEERFKYLQEFFKEMKEKKVKITIITNSLSASIGDSNRPKFLAILRIIIDDHFPENELICSATSEFKGNKALTLEAYFEAKKEHSAKGLSATSVSVRGAPTLGQDSQTHEKTPAGSLSEKSVTLNSQKQEDTSNSRYILMVLHTNRMACLVNKVLRSKIVSDKKSFLAYDLIQLTVTLNNAICYVISESKTELFNLNLKDNKDLALFTKIFKFNLHDIHDILTALPKSENITFFILREGTPYFQSSGNDVPLVAEGDDRETTALDKVKKNMPNITKFDQVYVSDLRRSGETAERFLSAIEDKIQEKEKNKIFVVLPGAHEINYTEGNCDKNPFFSLKNWGRMRSKANITMCSPSRRKREEVSKPSLPKQTPSGHSDIKNKLLCNEVYSFKDEAVTNTHKKETPIRQPVHTYNKDWTFYDKVYPYGRGIGRPTDIDLKDTNPIALAMLHMIIKIQKRKLIKGSAGYLRDWIKERKIHHNKGTRKTLLRGARKGLLSTSWGLSHASSYPLLIRAEGGKKQTRKKR